MPPNLLLGTIREPFGGTQTLAHEGFTPEEQDLREAIFAYWKTWHTFSTVPPSLAMMCQDLIVGPAKNATMPLRLGLDSPRFPRIRKDSLDSLRFSTIRSHSPQTLKSDPAGPIPSPDTEILPHAVHKLGLAVA